MQKNTKLMLAWLAISFIWMYDLYDYVRLHSNLMKVLCAAWIVFSVSRAYHFYKLPEKVVPPESEVKPE